MTQSPTQVYFFLFIITPFCEPLKLLWSALNSRVNTRSGNTPERVATTSGKNKLLNPFDPDVFSRKTLPPHPIPRPYHHQRTTERLSMFIFVSRPRSYEPPSTCWALASLPYLPPHPTGPSPSSSSSAPPTHTHTCSFSHTLYNHPSLLFSSLMFKYSLSSHTRSGSLKDQNSHQRTRGASFLPFGLLGSRNQMQRQRHTSQS